MKFIHKILNAIYDYDYRNYRNALENTSKSELHKEKDVEPLKFSILIYNYNQGMFFKNCFDSIIEQKCSNWEAIILDDCSTDNSVMIIKNIIGNDKRFCIHENISKIGFEMSKTKLIGLSVGKVYGFLNCEDELADNALRNIIIKCR
ncbi:glycosyltransferase family A protein [Chryseobacterium sp. Chry.R1]|uniref:glycosyltransferase family A protein n=1 Tax=Chryseobacterium sp. Chry.R1 TaxID=3139392 RepID=UPI0031F95FB6